MPDVLAEILTHARREVEQARRAMPLERLTSQPGYYLPCRNFFGVVAAPRLGGPNLIAEIKQRSPSAGLLRADLDPAALAREVEAAGARAVCVATDEQHFGGRLEHIAQVKAAAGLPVLRGGILIDSYQVHESRAYGADAVVVMADAVEPALAADLVELARRLDLATLLEIHDRPRARQTLGLVLDRTMSGVVVGIQNRDPHTQQLDLGTVEALAPLVPPGMPIVAMGGLRTRADVERMHAAGARAVVVGEVLLRSANVGATIRALFGRPR